MTQRTQVARAYTTGETPSGQPEGTPFVNFADLNLLVQGPSDSVIDLLPIKRFSATANYAAGSLVEYSGSVYSNAAPVGAGAWNPSDWTTVLSDSTALYLNQQNWAFTLSYTGDNVTGVLASLGALRVRQTISYDSDGNPETIEYETSADSGGSYSAAVTLTITYDADGNPLSGAWT